MERGFGGESGKGRERVRKERGFTSVNVNVIVREFA